MVRNPQLHGTQVFIDYEGELGRPLPNIQIVEEHQIQ